MIVKSKTEKELAIMREGGRRLAAVLDRVLRAVREGITTKFLDELADRQIREAGGVSAFLGYEMEGSDGIPFPSTICVSINDEVVHAIPKNDRMLKEGDLVSVDIGMIYQGLYVDMARTVGVGTMSKEARRILVVTEEALLRGIREAKSGNRMGNIGAAIQRWVEGEGFSVVRSLVGHGIGKKLHEEPAVPNWGTPNRGIELQKGMTLAIEPMVTLGRPEVETEEDGWTVRTRDRMLACHAEHTVVVTKHGGSILTKT